jgi:hypothetical protein
MTMQEYATPKCPLCGESLGLTEERLVTMSGLYLEKRSFPFPLLLARDENESWASRTVIVFCPAPGCAWRIEAPGRRAWGWSDVEWVSALRHAGALGPLE